MLNNEFPPLGGGTGTVNQALLERLKDRSDLKIDLVTSALGSRPEKESFSPNINLYKVPVRNKNIHHSSNRELVEYAARGLWQALKLHRQCPYDRCFAWSGVPAGGIALMLRCITGLRYILRVCGPDIPGFEQRYQTTHVMLSPLLRRIWRGAELVVAKSENEVQMIRAVDSDVKCVLIPNGVDIDRFRPAHSATYHGPLRLLCVARLIERKGQHHLIQAIKRLVDDEVHVTLKFVGAGDKRTANEAQVNRLGLTDHIHFAGYVPREQIPLVYAAADVFVLPSYNEGMSVALLEAMSAGLAIVATRAAVTPELVQPELNGLLFEWADVDTLTKHLRRLANDRSLAKRMGEASRSRAASFSWTAVADRYLEVLGLQKR